jgi:DNA mismatch repair protein MSH4
MTMLYRVTPGAVKEAHYGLTLARVVPLPPGVVDRAAHIALKLEAHMLKKKKASETVLREKRRKLILNLRIRVFSRAKYLLRGSKSCRRSLSTG